MAGEELLLGANPLLAIASGFEFVLSRGGLEGPPVTGDPGEVIPYSVGPAVSMEDAMAAYSTAFGSVDPYYDPTGGYGDAPAQQVQPPGATFPWPAPGGGVAPGTSITVPAPIPGVGGPPAFPPLEGMGGRLPPDAEFSLPAEPPPWWLRMGVGLGGLLWPSEIGEEWPDGNPAVPGPDPVWMQQDRPDLFPGTIVDSPTPDWWEREAMKELDRQAAAQQQAEDDFRRETQRILEQARQPAPAPTAVPSLRTRLWPWIGLGLGVAGLAGRRSSSTVPQSSFTSFVDPITAGNTAATTYASPQASGAGAWGGGWGSQTCEPAKRGPRRKCLERAAVKWSGGRRKGKAAGSKCLRFSTRKS